MSLVIVTLMGVEDAAGMKDVSRLVEVLRGYVWLMAEGNVVRSLTVARQRVDRVGSA